MIFVKCADLVTKREILAGELGLTTVQKEEMKDETHYRYFCKLLGTWISQEHKAATWLKLISVLQELGFNLVAGTFYF